ncbi:hypothetical protein JF535_06085 [Microbulbifer salipaludis]|uniref:Lipoprotein n=1 Tax=Microbulbifer salipaludis TaxID=187980 RepID=A0ABS3E573_9GAMM|nr:hypothetical protein [Microbulbifer salipaludis]MBN8430422.1 hypothetical protein [Microbulbifer salipaludis]
MSLLSLTAGCALKDEYPPEWEPVAYAKSGGCQDISGLYRNLGENSKRKEVYLSSVLFPKERDPSSVDYVKIVNSRESSSLEITLFNDSKPIKSVNITSESVISCKNGSYVIERGDFLAKEGAIGKQWVRYSFSKSGNSLILAKKNGAVGALFFVPIVGSETGWLRFQQP